MSDNTKPVLKQGSAEEIQNRFAYHAPKTDAVKEAHEDARALCHSLAVQLMALMPDCREKSVVITKIEEVMFWANAGIARNQ